MRRSLFRITALAAVALAAITCRDPASAPNAARRARIALVPQYTPEAERVRAELAAFAIVIDNVHLVITRAGNVVVKDTIVSFPASANAITIGVDVDLVASEETLGAAVELRQGTVSYFAGTQTVVARQGSTTPAAEPVTLSYVGPGKTAAFLALSPKAAIISTAGSQQYATVAFTSTEQTVTDLPIGFSSSDPTIATISTGGLAQGTGKTGVVTIVAAGLNGVADSATLTVVAQPAQLLWVTQPSVTAQAGVQLGAQPAVRLADASGRAVALPGVTVTATLLPAALTLSGTATAVTDANGVATFTNLTIGGPVQTATLSVSAPQVPAITAPVRMSAGPIAQLLKLSGDGQSGTVAANLASPLTIATADAFGNRIAGQDIVFQISGGSAYFTPPVPLDVAPPQTITLTTAADGTASAPVTLGSTAGPVQVTATATGTSLSPVVFTATALAGAAARLIILQQPPSTVQAARVFAPQPSVGLVDQYGNAVATAGVPVTVSIVTPAGAVGGSISGTSTIATQSNGSASFSGLGLNVLIGTYQLAFSSSNSAIAGVTSNPVQVTPGDPASLSRYAWTDSQTVFQATTPQVRVTDAAGNGVSGVKITWAPLAGSIGTLDSSTTQSGNAVTYTDASGYANAGLWTPPFGIAGSFTLTASGTRPDGTALGGSPATFTVLTGIGLAPTPEPGQWLGMLVGTRATDSSESP